MLRHGLQEIAGRMIELPRSERQRPRRDFLAERDELFRKAGWKTKRRRTARSRSGSANSEGESRGVPRLLFSQTSSRLHRVVTIAGEYALVAFPDCGKEEACRSEPPSITRRPP